MIARPQVALLLVLAACSTQDLAPVEPPSPPEAPKPDPCQPLTLAHPEVEMGTDDRPVPPIVDAARLEPFFERAAALLRGRATDHVRIAIYGDSNLTLDYLSGHMRRWLQLTYGDAGHGFVASIKPWGHYKHMDVRHGTSSGWEPYAVTTDPVLDRMYGVSGIAAESLHKHAASWVATAEPGAPIGTRMSSAEVFFLKGKRFGQFDVEVDGTKNRTVDTSGDRPELGVERIEVEDGAHEIRFVAADHLRRTRLLGVAIERDQPGFVVDSYGVGSLNTLSLARPDPNISRPMLERRGYDLVIFATGANDPFTIDRVPGAMAQVIELHREALPGVAMLMLTPADRGMRRTFPGTLKVIAQRELMAREHGIAFWNLFAAMGGPDAMARLHLRGMVKNDYIHYTEKGGDYVGRRLLHAMWSAFDDYLAAHPRAGCDAPPRQEATTKRSREGL